MVHFCRVPAEFYLHISISQAQVVIYERTVSVSLLPANEVWGKVMFIRSVAVGLLACITGHITNGLTSGRGWSASRGSGSKDVCIRGSIPEIHGILSASGRYASYWNAFLCKL